MKIVQKALFIAFILGYFSCGLLLRIGVAVPELIYWFFFLAIPISCIFLMSQNEKSNIFILLATSISVYSMFFLQNHTWYPSARDTLFDMQLVSSIEKSGQWYAGMGTAMAVEHSPYPLMHLFLVSVSLLSGINPYQSLFLIPWLKGVVFILFLYLLSRNVTTNNRLRCSVAFIATLIYLGCFSYVGYPHSQIFGEIFFIGSLWTLTMVKRGLAFKTILIFFTFAVALSHHFTAFIFVMVAVCAYLLEKNKKTINAFLSIIIVISQAIFVSWRLTYGYLVNFADATSTILGLNNPASTGQIGAAVSYYYTFVEFLIIIANPIIVGVLSIVSFIWEIKNRHKDVSLKILTSITVIVSILTILAIAFLLSGSAMATSAYRIWSFAYIPLSIWVSLLLLRRLRKTLFLKTILLLIVIIAFASMNLSVMYGIKKWYVPRAYMETYRFSDSMVYTGMWSGLYLNGSIIGDNLAYNFLSSFGCKEVNNYAFTSWYVSKNELILEDFDYIALSPWDKSTYSDTFREPIDPFVRLPNNLNIVYSSDDFTIYYNKKQPV